MRRTGALVIALVLAAPSCSEPGALVRDEVMSLVPRTLPLRTPMPYVDIQHSSGMMTASWRFDVASEWLDYHNRLVDHLKPEYSLQSSSETELVFSRVLEADAFRLVLRRGGTSVRCEFLARPF